MVNGPLLAATDRGEKDMANCPIGHEELAASNLWPKRLAPHSQQQSISTALPLS